MEKDLALAGFSYSFVSSESKSLIKELRSFLKKQDQKRDLRNIFYQTDVNIQSKNIALDDYESLAILLWNRVLQKVVSRKLYK
ncbi:hypothetical protein GYB22_07055 [bacterium]|nr:hypothetical protein [bacterium]